MHRLPQRDNHVHVHRMVPGVWQHVLVPERSQPVEDKRLDDGGIAVVLAAVDDDRGSRAVVLASLFVRVDLM